ncbi:MAG TPA: chaperone modulator CbpM [Acetobacteraceae bacterium]|nr:chaperone modulator CbpM [Acetobacteraceae bacterium]
MHLEALIAQFGDLPAVELTSWVERGWVQPDTDGDTWEFHEIDVARVRLIHDLRHDMEVNEDAIPLVLSLLDQVYELRGQLRRMLAAVEGQPAELRAAIVAALRD